MAAGHNQNSPTRTRRRQADYLPALTRVVLALIVVCTLLTMGFAFYPEWTRLSDMRHDLAKQKARLAELQKQAADRAQEVDLLQHDPEYLEMIARDRLDLMKNGETIFRLSAAHPRS